MEYKLIIGPRNSSAESLSAWLFMRESGFDFSTERALPPEEEGATGPGLTRPRERIPLLVDTNLRVSVWEPLAIIEHLRDRYRDMALDWPRRPEDRALAWAICAELYASFATIRNQMPFDIKARSHITPSEPLDRELARIGDIWGGCRTAHGDEGPWLFGRRLTIPDVVFAPMALRFVSYGVDLGDPARSYVDAITGLTSVQEWIADADAEHLPEVSAADPRAISAATADPRPSDGSDGVAEVAVTAPS